jgi:hypothetical protein
MHTHPIHRFGESEGERRREEGERERERERERGKKLIYWNTQPVVKKLVKATGAENYNVLQNNGRIAHQEVDHVSQVSFPIHSLISTS